MQVVRRLSVVFGVAIVMTAACARQGTDVPDTSAGGDVPGAGADVRSASDLRAEMTRLEERARALAKVDGCDSVGECKAAPVGERACGGPREYIVYCAVSTDEAALLATLDTLKRTEMRLNEIERAVSTCEYRRPPDLEVVGGSCRVRE